MSRLIASAALAFASMTGLAGTATAQFLPSPPGIPVSPYRYFTGQVLVNNLGQSYSLGFIRTTPLGHSYTYLPSTGYNPIYASQSNAIRQARRQQAFSPETTERREIATRSSEVRHDRTSVDFYDGLPTAFKSAIQTTSQADILSGKALNDILATTIDLEKRGARANGAYLAPELVSALRFAGNASADLSNWTRAREIDYPAVFQTDEYRTPRSWLKHDFGLVATSILAGKMPESSLYQGLVTAGKTIRRTFEEQKSKLSAGEVRVGEQFLTRFDAMTSIVRSPNSSDLGLADWSNLGVSLIELIDHLDKHKMQFGPAPTGQDEAYLALHKAMAEYALSLAEVRP